MAIDWLRLELDVAGFEPQRWAPSVEELRSRGLRFSTLAELGNTPENQRKVYEINRTCAADIPDRGEFHSWPDYHRLRLLAPGHRPDGLVVALDGDEWVGMSEVSFQPHRDFAFQQMTGVLSSHRRQGIALAMKALTMDFVATTGATTVRTVHHPKNTSMITLNRQLGYRDGDWDYPLTD